MVGFIVPLESVWIYKYCSCEQQSSIPTFIPSIFPLASPLTSVFSYHFFKQSNRDKSQSVFWAKKVHVGMEPSKSRRESHHNTFTPSLHLVPFCQLCVHHKTLYMHITPTKWMYNYTPMRHSPLLTPLPFTYKTSHTCYVHPCSTTHPTAFHNPPVHTNKA